MDRRTRFILVFLVCFIAVVAFGLQFRREAVYSKDAKARVQLNMLAEELKDYAARSGAFPIRTEGLQALVRSRQLNPEGIKDPWGREITYECVDEHCTTVRLASGGEGGSSNAYILEVSRTPR
jgi:hypothetical protein